MNRRLSFIITTISFLSFFSAKAQDSLYARQIVSELTSEKYYGRGYTHDGMLKAAFFLQEEFKKNGLQSFDDNNYFQPFAYSVNTFPGEMKVSLNNKLLVPGKDYIISPESKGVHKKVKLLQSDSVTFKGKSNISVVLKDKLTWSVAPYQSDNTVIFLNKNNFAETPADINLQVDSKFIPKFVTANICGYVKGTTYPDSIIYITAHYDHLGGMGNETYFPGANDNASGVSLLITLAKYYSTHPQPYSIGFICFAGEEIGLIGSGYFTQYPLHPLQQTKFLINLDLVGTGDEGIMVVNATEHRNEFDLLKKINSKHNYLYQIKERGKAANSDHHYFAEQNVPCFFIYTMGGIGAYHDIFDKGETLPLTSINNLSALLKEFIEALQ